MKQEMLNELSRKIIGAAIEVHSYFGPGLLENTYRDALLKELRIRNIKAEKEVEIPCVYKGHKLEVAYRADIIVENAIILELKATENDHPVYYKQLYTYLKITKMQLGLLINFNKSRLIDGVDRIVNGI